jgi:hypothetical protein
MPTEQGPPDGKSWIAIEGLYQDDLFEVDSASLEEEIAAARKQFRERYPMKNVVLRAGRVIAKTEG